VTLRIESAMILAAGLGKRMRPLTATRPKPLVPVAGRPLIDHCLDKLRETGVSTVIINVHYLADALEAHLRSLDYPFAIRISDERDLLLETGGGLVKAQPLIDGEIFYCINSDNLWTDGPQNSLARLAHRWDDSAMDALLLLVPQARAHNYRGMGDFRLDLYGKVSRRLPDRQAPFIFTGIQLLSKRLLANAPAGPFSTNILWDRAIAAGRLYGLVHEGSWFDVGTPQAIAPTEALLAER
jgi:MurNAc alpha-1-phosphate uridylyltransferase